MFQGHMSLVDANGCGCLFAGKLAQGALDADDAAVKRAFFPQVPWFHMAIEA